jgi:hypothetical protein
LTGDVKGVKAKWEEVYSHGGREKRKENGARAVV